MAPAWLRFGGLLLAVVVGVGVVTGLLVASGFTWRRSDTPGRSSFFVHEWPAQQDEVRLKP